MTRPARTPLLILAAITLLIAAVSEAGDVSGLPATLHRGLLAPGRAWTPALAIGLAQRAIEEPRRDEPRPPDEPESPDEPVPAETLVPAAAPVEPKSPLRAMLLSAALPGLGEFYVGSNRAYLFMGTEAVSWLTWGYYRSSSSNKEDEMRDFADANFSIELFGDKCVGQSGQSCQGAVEKLEEFFAVDRDEYYETISKNPIYKAGWGVMVFENSEEPEPGTEAHRVWIADFAARQDMDFINYNVLRDDRNNLARTARAMTAVALLNHVASAWHAFALAGGLSTSTRGGFDVNLKLEPGLRDPGARLVVSRSFL